MATLGMLLVALMVALGQATVAAQTLSEVPPNGHGVCRGRDIKDPKSMQELRNCSVIDGNLRILSDHRYNFTGHVLPYLREITGHLVMIYPKRVTSLGMLFPRLQRIRGRHLFFDYALFLLEMTDLNEIGLYDLTTVDRGGVFIWEFYYHLTCYATTLDWGAIAAEGRTVISQTRQGRCACPGCGGHCWNPNYPQRFLEGARAERCHPACLGCARAAPARCTRCRHYTDHGRCMPACPADKVVLEGPQYCLTKRECLEIFEDAIIHENRCLTTCPVGMVRDPARNICVPSPTQQKICPSLKIEYRENIHLGFGCKYINGSLEIKLNSSINIQEELANSLSTVEVIDHYLEINSTMFITSLDFLPSLRKINGKVLKHKKYSLVLFNNRRLNQTFSDKVLNNLIIKAGTMNVNGNPFLCHNEIDKLRPKLLVQANDSVDVVKSKNGIAGTCNVILRNMNISDVTDTSSVITFVPTKSTGATYHLYYIHWAPNKQHDVSLGANGCWGKKPINSTVSLAKIDLLDLTPSTFYIFFIEATDDENLVYGRSALFNFTTLIGILAPPFITEITSAPDKFYVTWLDHHRFTKSISHYYMEITINEVNEGIFEKKDFCKYSLDLYGPEEFRHKYFKEPTIDYVRDCQVYCESREDPLFNMKSDIFEICGPRGLNCAGEEPAPTKNLTVNGIKKHIVIKIPAGIKNYTVDGLQPYTDYRTKIRACIHAQCSRSSRQTIRTLIVESIGTPIIEDTLAVDGVVTVKWSKPTMSNGPVLAYTIEIRKDYQENSTYAYGFQQWCVNMLTYKQSQGVFTAKTEYISEDVLLRVCSISTGVNRICTPWLSVVMHTKPVAWWISSSLMGIAVLGFIIYVRKRRSKHSDRELLINEDSDTDCSPPHWSCGEPMRYSTLLRDDT